MFDQEPPIRPPLTAPRLVALNLEGALDDWAHRPPAEPPLPAAAGAEMTRAATAFDILAGWCSLRRMEPALLAPRERAILERAQALVRQEGQALLAWSLHHSRLVEFEERALALVSAGERIEAALGEAYQRVRQLEEDPDEDPQVGTLQFNQSEVNDAIGELFAEADDARLWVAAALALGADAVPEAWLAAAMERVEAVDDFIEAHDDLFMAAAGYAGAFADALGKDLEARDPILWTTARLLQQFAMWQREAEQEGLVPLLEALRAAQQAGQEQAAQAAQAAQSLLLIGLLNWMRQNLLLRQAALQFGTEKPPTVSRVLWWVSPDGRHVARLVLSDALTEKDALEILLLDRRGGICHDHDGRTLTLEGVSAPLAQGRASIAIGQLAASPSQAGSLRVGEQGWTFQGETLNLWPPPETGNENPH